MTDSAVFGVEVDLWWDKKCVNYYKLKQFCKFQYISSPSLIVLNTQVESTITHYKKFIEAIISHKKYSQGIPKKYIPDGVLLVNIFNGSFLRMEIRRMFGVLNILNTSKPQRPNVN